MGMGEGVHAYYLTALDFETGRLASEVFIGSGERIDNPMLSVDFLEGGVMMTGVRNGIVTLCDSETDTSGTPVCVKSEQETGGSSGCAVSYGTTPLSGAILLLVLVAVVRRQALLLSLEQPTTKNGRSAATLIIRFIGPPT
jgi:hypothetical protein